MEQYIKKSAIVAEIERMKVDAIQFPFEEYGTVGTCNKLLSFLDTLEVKDANEALRTEYEKGRIDVIAKACQFLHDYQEYPNHDIATDKLVEAFKMYIEL